MESISQHPRLRIFLPLIYRIHEDQLISTDEEKVVFDFFDGITWLTEVEKNTINELLKSGALSSSDLAEIKSEIKSLIQKDRLPNYQGIIDLGKYLIEDKGATWVKEVISLQNNLGFLNYESIYHFFPEWRKSESVPLVTDTSFNVKSVQSILDGDHSGLIKELKKILHSDGFEFKQRDDMFAFRNEILKANKLLAKKGYGAIGYPDAYGGFHDMASYFTVMETISMVDLSMTIKFGVQFGLFGGSVLNLGTKKHHDKYLSKIGTLELPGCFAMTETGHGSNVKGIETTAHYNHTDRSFTINTPNTQAQKDYIGNAAMHGQMATVFAKLIIENVDYGVAAFLVPIRDAENTILPNISIEDCGLKMGLNGVDNGKIRFHNVIIPYDALLDKYASIDDAGKFQSPIASENKRFFTMLGTLVGGRIGVPKSALTATKIGLATTIHYGSKRKQFGPDKGPEVPILNYRMHQRRLIPLIAKTYALHFSLKYITDRYVLKSESDAQEIEAIAAGLKAYTTWHNTFTLQTCREACGGRGFISAMRIDDLKNDSDVYTTFEGDNTVLMQLVAKSRLIEFKQSFHQIGFTGYIRYFASQAFSSVAQKNPFVVRTIDEDHLLDSDFHLNAFRYREQDLVSSVAKRLKRLLDDGMDSFDATNVVQHHLIQAAEAYIERIILEQFYISIQKINDKPSAHILSKVYNLFALFTIESHKDWYLESEYMAPVKTKAIRKLVNQLCWELRADAVPLVDGFGIEEKWLGDVNN